MSSVLSMLFTSLPLFSLFVMGIYSCVLAIMVDDELEARKLVLSGIQDGSVLRAEGMVAQELRQHIEEEKVSNPPQGGKPI